jgi:hypothetical protein
LPSSPQSTRTPARRGRYWRRDRGGSRRGRDYAARPEPEELVSGFGIGSQLTGNDIARDQIDAVKHRQGVDIGPQHHEASDRLREVLD